MKLIITPLFDSDNTDPLDVTLCPSSMPDGRVRIELQNPRRVVEISGEDWRTALRAMLPESER